MRDDLKERAAQFTKEMFTGAEGSKANMLVLDGGNRECRGSWGRLGFCSRVEALLASERAAALGAAADVVHPCGDACSVVDHAYARHLATGIRSLTPTGWLGVRAEDLDVVKEAAHEALAHYYAPLEELAQYKDRADEIRAALSRVR